MIAAIDEPASVLTGERAMMALLRPALEGAGDGSSDPRAGSEGGFRRRPHGARAGSARIDRVGLAQAGRRSEVADARRRL